MFIFTFSALTGKCFTKDTDAAFANTNFWCNAATCLAFSYSHLLCTSTKIYILIASTLLAMLCYIGAECITRKEGGDENGQEHVASVEADAEKSQYSSQPLVVNTDEPSCDPAPASSQLMNSGENC